jgi:hypothetical protein
MKVLLLLALPLALAGEASLLAAQSGAPTTRAEHGAHRNRDRIDHEEVVRSTATDAYQLVQSLRGMWFNRHEARLNTEATSSEGNEGLVVLLDNALLGGKDALHEIPMVQIYSVEFLTASQLHQRYDRNARDGGIVVHTGPDSDPGVRPAG